jgi:hypothetical protein
MVGGRPGERLSDGLMTRLPGANTQVSGKRRQQVRLAAYVSHRESSTQFFGCVYQNLLADCFCSLARSGLNFPASGLCLRFQRNEGSNNCSLARLRIDVKLSAD